MHMLRWIVVGLITGFAVSKTLRSEATGTPVGMILGVLGAVAAGGAMHSYGFGMAAALPVAVAGAVVLVFVVNLITRATQGSGVGKAA